MEVATISVTVYLEYGAGAIGPFFDAIKPFLYCN